jgi:UDP-glucose 6-dehydrogenase
MKINVFGLGHVHSTTAVRLAACERDVIGAEVNPEKLASFHVGRTPLFEPGLAELLGPAHLKPFTTVICHSFVLELRAKKVDNPTDHT